MRTTKIAVIDIGSNSVRLVIYDGLNRTPTPLFNEKVLCGLARGMEQTGRLNEQGAKVALLAIARFSALLKIMLVDDVIAFATSAVRDAEDGKNFVEEIKDKTGFVVTIFSGEEESQFATLGVISSMEDVSGVVGDLGGGSLELATSDYQLNSKYKNFSDIIDAQISFPIGSLRLRGMANGDKKIAVEVVKEELTKYKIKDKLNEKNFYAVGGGFRALAKHYIDTTKYPVSVLHEYKVDAESFLKTIKYISGMSSENILHLKSLPNSRADTLAYTAIVMQSIIETGNPKNIIFSTHGVREGVLTNALTDEQQILDPLIESVSDIIRHLSPGGDSGWVRFGHELYEWMTPLFRNEDDTIRRLRLAGCILSRLAWHEHTAYQAEMAFRWVLDATIPAIDHDGRVFVGTCVFHRYQTDVNVSLMGESQKILDKEMIYRARVIGNAMRLGFAISGGAIDVLKRTPLTLKDDDVLILSAKNKKDKILLGTSAETRLKKLGSLTGLTTILDN